MKKKIESIVDLIRKMESNTFLLKDSWSETIPMITTDYEYRTYVGQRTDKDRYINIELFKLGIQKVEILFRKKEIHISKPIDFKFDINDVFNIVESIFNEVHSFKNHDEGLRLVKSKIIDCKRSIKLEEERLVKLQQELSDALILNSEPLKELI